MATPENLNGNHVAELNAALAAAQGEFPPIPRDKKVTVKTKDGGTYSFAYAPLEAILAATRPALTKHGLAVTQAVEDIGAGLALRTELRHKSGGMIGSSFPLGQQPGSPQQLGSLLTYLRRYALTALLGVAAEEDDDGQQAAEAKPAAKPASDPKMITPAQHKKIAVMIGELKAGNHDLPGGYEGAEDWGEVGRMHIVEQYGVESRKDLTSAQASELIDWLESMKVPF